MVKNLLLAWRNPQRGEWIPVGRLSYHQNKFVFQYTIGAQKCLKDKIFIPFANMSEISQHYESDQLFPLFQNRLLPKSRPEYQAYLEWLNLEENSFSPLDELARSGGIRVTDNLQLFPIPEEADGKYEVTFFSHGIRHLPVNYIERIKHLKTGSKLYLMKDMQNKWDSFALALRTDDPPELVGYSPRLFSRDFNRLIKTNLPENIHIMVKKINLDSPLQFRLLCNLTTTWPVEFTAFKDEEFQPAI